MNNLLKGNTDLCRLPRWFPLLQKNLVSTKVQLLTAAKKENWSDTQDGQCFLVASSRQTWSCLLTNSWWKPLVSHPRNKAWRMGITVFCALSSLSLSTHQVVNSSSCMCICISQTHSQPALSHLTKWKNTHSSASVTSQSSKKHKSAATVGNIQPTGWYPIQGLAQSHYWGWRRSEIGKCLISYQTSCLLSSKCQKSLPNKKKTQPTKQKTLANQFVQLPVLNWHLTSKIIPKAD